MVVDREPLFARGAEVDLPRRRAAGGGPTSRQERSSLTTPVWGFATRPGGAWITGGSEAGVAYDSDDSIDFIE